MTKFISAILTAKGTRSVLKNWQSDTSAPGTTGSFKPADLDEGRFMLQNAVQTLPPLSWDVKGGKRLQGDLDFFVKLNHDTGNLNWVI